MCERLIRHRLRKKGKGGEGQRALVRRGSQRKKGRKQARDLILQARQRKKKKKRRKNLYHDVMSLSGREDRATGKLRAHAERVRSKKVHGKKKTKSR